MIENLNIGKDCRVRIISDIHLGHKKSLVSSPEALLPLLNGCDMLICLGDTAETRIGPYREQGVAQLEKLHSLCRNLGKQLLVIGGNHDPDTPSRAAFMDGGRIFMMHGDALFKTGAPWGREFLQNKKLIRDIIRKYPENGKTLPDRLAMNKEVAAAIPAILSREYGKNKYINFFLHASWPPDRPLRIVGSWFLYKHLVRRFAHRYAPDSRIIITGHMHRRSLFVSEGKLFINTGAFFKYAHPWVIDIQGDHLSVSPVLQDFTPAPPERTYSLNRF